MSVLVVLLLKPGLRFKLKLYGLLPRSLVTGSKTFFDSRLYLCHMINNSHGYRWDRLAAKSLDPFTDCAHRQFFMPGRSSTDFEIFWISSVDVRVRT
jgi:hypothetical protein